MRQAHLEKKQQTQHKQQARRYLMGGGRAATDLNGVFMHFVNLDLGKSIAFGSEKKVVLKCLVVICGQVGMSQVHVSEPLCNRRVLNVQDSMAAPLCTPHS